MHRLFPLTNSLSQALPAAALIISGLAAAALFAYCLRRTHWRRLAQYPFTLHAFCLWTLILTLFSIGRTGVLAGLELHLYGITAATLMMGWKIAYPAVIISQLFLCILGFEPLALLGWNALIFAALPVLISEGFCRALRRILPHNPFIFTLGAGFFGGIITMAAIMLANTAALALFSAYHLDIIADKYLKFSPIIIYPEGFINGVIITGLVAFHPRIISAFDPDRYFINHP